MMNNKMPLSGAVINLSDNFDDLLESLSTLQRLGELPVHKLTEQMLLKNALEILHQSCKATNCTVFTIKDGGSALPDTKPLGNILTINSIGEFHNRAATRIEDKFIRNTISAETMQHCNDCSTLVSDCTADESETSIISVPLRVNNQLDGVITISHSDREHFNPWGYRLMQLFSTFLGQQLTMCRFQANLKHD
ncbi:MAG: GAF domain-containing protein [Desulfuromonas sp.]|nr:GAF domain-containing protein [Desulfuromonas sp.]